MFTSIIIADGVDALPSSLQMPNGELPEVSTGLVKTTHKRKGKAVDKTLEKCFLKELKAKKKKTINKIKRNSSESELKLKSRLG